MHSATFEHARKLWTYLSSRRARETCDAVIVCCSYDLRVCDYACELIKQKLAPRLVVTGNRGNWTRHLWDTPEAHVFRRRALANEIDPDMIVVEDQAGNFGENVAFVRQLMPDLVSATFVTKPNSVLRVSLTVPVQWPEITAFVDAPPLVFPDNVSNVIGVLGLIHEMVGDVDRVIQYPTEGFQVSHPVPSEIVQSCRYLVSEGFDQHLLPNSALRLTD